MEVGYAPIKVSASPKQQSRLRNGHKVRIAPPIEGEGVNLIVSPERLNNISKCFRSGKGTIIQLSPAEINANKMSGEGIFGKQFDRFVAKNIGKKNRKLVYGLAEKIGKPLLEKGLDAAEVAALAAAPEAAPAISAVKRVAKGYIAKPTQYQENPAKMLMKDLNPMKVAMDTYKQNKKSSSASGKGFLDTIKKVAKASVKATKSKVSDIVGGEGLYASSSMRGRGVMGRGALMSVGNSGLPPALQSQNGSANFMFHTQLPPSYAELKRYGVEGNGLY
jgi:hypothetical protein